MISLAMDTAGNVCAACLYDSERGQILAEVSEEIGRGHAERLMGIISDVLAEAKISYNDIDKVITTVGPGSFTGIRVGVATARGFGVGLGIPVVGVTNLEAVMAEARQSGRHDSACLMLAVMEAGRGHAYAQANFKTVFADANDPFMASLGDIASAVGAGLNGRAGELVLCGGQAEALASAMDSPVTIADTPPAPRISVIAHLGADREEGSSRPEPLYLRKPDAKPQQGFAVERKA